MSTLVERRRRTLNIYLHLQSASIINVFPFLDLIPGPMPWRKRGAEFRLREETVYAKLASEAIEGKNSNIEKYASLTAMSTSSLTLSPSWAQYFAGKDNGYGDHRELINLFAVVRSIPSSYLVHCLFSFSGCCSLGSFWDLHDCRR